MRQNLIHFRSVYDLAAMWVWVILQIKSHPIYIIVPIPIFVAEILIFDSQLSILHGEVLVFAA